MEIERKFLVKHMPDLTNVHPVEYDRYFLSFDPEVRIQRKGDRFEHEVKKQHSHLSAEKTKRSISAKEFETMKQSNVGHIQRTCYEIEKSPRIIVSQYHGNLKGFVRVEVEFSSEQEAKDFIPLAWFGEEITGTPLGNDKYIARLSPDVVRAMIK
jgi:adenylate cyclase